MHQIQLLLVVFMQASGSKMGQATFSKPALNLP